MHSRKLNSTQLLVPPTTHNNLVGKTVASIFSQTSEISGLSGRVNRLGKTRLFIHNSHVLETDRQTDGQTDRKMISMA